MSKHTPGPWKAEVSPHDNRVVLINSKEHGAVGEIIYVDTRRAADALLIVAAPDLLEELRRARAYISEHHNSFVEGVTSPVSGLIEDPQDLVFAEANQDLLNGIDAAIAKATNQGGV